MYTLKKCKPYCKVRWVKPPYCRASRGSTRTWTSTLNIQGGVCNLKVGASLVNELRKANLKLGTVSVITRLCDTGVVRGLPGCGPARMLPIRPASCSIACRQLTNPPCAPAAATADPCLTRLLLQTRNLAVKILRRAFAITYKSIRNKCL